MDMMNETPRMLDQLKEDGFTIIPSGLSVDSCRILASEIDRIHLDYHSLKQRFPELYKLEGWSVRSAHTASKLIKDFVLSSAFADFCTRRLGPDVDLYFANTAIKPRAQSKAFPWHQDAGYEKGPREYLTCWTALDETDEDNGCLWVLPKSHLRGILRHSLRLSDVENYAGMFLAEAVDVSMAVPVRLQPGQIVCMDSKLIHGTKKNRSGRPRRGLISAYARADLIQKHRHEMDKEPVICIRSGEIFR